MIASSLLESRALQAKSGPIVRGSSRSFRASSELGNRDSGTSRGDHIRAERSHLEQRKAETIGHEVFELNSSDAGKAGQEYTGHQIIFVLLMPQGSDDSNFQGLSMDPAHLTSRIETKTTKNGATLQVNLPSAVRLSTVRDEILAGIARASVDTTQPEHIKRSSEPSVALPHLTRREREVLQMILEGHPNKNIAADLRISMRTVENHRAKVMKKTGSKSLPALVRLAIAAGAMPEATQR
jgi:DNA-binding CsgD family transcriptional regulator